MIPKPIQPLTVPTHLSRPPKVPLKSPDSSVLVRKKLFWRNLLVAELGVWLLYLSPQLSFS